MVVYLCSGQNFLIVANRSTVYIISVFGTLVNSCVSLFTLIKEVFPMFLKWMFWKRKWGVDWHFKKKFELDINVTTKTLLLLKNHSTPHEGFIFVECRYSKMLWQTVL